MNKSIYILGVGHNTPVVMELAESAGYQVEGLFHYEKGREGETIHGIRIVGSNDDLFSRGSLEGMNFSLSMGDNQIRTSLADKIRQLGGCVPTLIHPSSFISKYAQIDEGVLVYAHSSIQSEVKILSDSVIGFNSVIAHNTIIERGCYLASLAFIGAYTHIGEKAFIGSGAVCVSGKVRDIGAEAVIGAGSVITKSIKSREIVVGNPGRTIKER